MLELAHWESCDTPPQEIIDGLTQLCELVTCDEDDIQGVIEIFVHRSGQFALSRRPIGGGWDWSFAQLDQRDREERRQRDWVPPTDVRSSLDRRTPQADWTAFITRYGNGTAE